MFKHPLFCEHPIEELDDMKNKLGKLKRICTEHCSSSEYWKKKYITLENRTKKPKPALAFCNLSPACPSTKVSWNEKKNKKASETYQKIKVWEEVLAINYTSNLVTFTVQYVDDFSTHCHQLVLELRSSNSSSSISLLPWAPDRKEVK